ncbi:hypothetical protein [Paenibacillus glucanolyticus]|uniref:hypothetical protein n=1 Tax=Paenibacillus glucanolyticus TaxID=59843 RepID=UPI0034CE2E09
MQENKSVDEYSDIQDFNQNLLHDEFGDEDHGIRVGDVKVDADGGLWGDDEEDKVHYKAPAGHIVTKIDEGVTNHQEHCGGCIRRIHGFDRRLDDETLTFEVFDERLRYMTGVLYNPVAEHEKIAQQMRLLRNLNPWPSGMEARAYVHANPGMRNVFEAEYYVDLFYVGNKSEVDNSLVHWLSGLNVKGSSPWHFRTITNGSRYPEFIYINSDKHFKDDVHFDTKLLHIWCSNNEWGSVAVETGPLPAGCEVVFTSEISLEGHSKHCELKIWELPEPSNPAPGSTGRVLINGIQTLEARYVTKNHGSYVKSEIYYHDNTQQRTTINLLKTKTYISKAF